MKIYLGLELDEQVFPDLASTQEGVFYLGPQLLLAFFETHLGLSGHPANIEYLRIEHCRQALQKLLSAQPGLFFAQSFEADQLATATRLLLMRDELLLAGWPMPGDTTSPDRLRLIAQLNQQLSQSDSFPAGYADRFEAVLQCLPQRKQPATEVSLVEPQELMPPHFRRLLTALAEKGVQINQLPFPKNEGDSDLARFQQLLSGDASLPCKPLRGDGSLLILRSARETEAASFLATLIRKNAAFRPLCLIPEKNRALDNALIQQGLPSLGILSASLARPMLQILKLVTTFFWKPVNPYKILEFVSLSLKPLHDELARRIAQQIAQRPGLKGEGWYRMKNLFFEELQEKAGQDTTIKLDQITFQYQFWFERTRYDINSTVPKAEVVEVFAYLAQWAFDQFEQNSEHASSLLVLSQQARRIKELLETLPETEQVLTNLELERIVRTVYEPSPVLFRPREVGHLPYVYQPGAVLGPTSDLLWWNFVRREREYDFSRWYANEIDYLATQGIVIENSAQKNQRLIWQRLRPVLFSRNRLILATPQRVNGKEVHPHPMHDQLEAAFADSLPKICLHLDQPENGKPWGEQFDLPQYSPLESVVLGRPQPFIRLTDPGKLQASDSTTFSSLQTYFHYPYQWLFRHQLELRKSSILSVVNDNTLLGNLAHRLFELLFDQPEDIWNKQAVEAWIDQKCPELFAREGATLLLYGREPERVAFINRLKYAAWSLLSKLQQNNWTVTGTEQDVKGTFAGLSIRGKADLVLQRGDERAVVDLKYRGARRRENSIRNEEDLQLVMYARLLSEGSDWAHSSYFIIEKGKLIARNNAAFSNIVAVQKEANHSEVNERIWERMVATYQWRRSQIEAGLIEVRTRQTIDELELSYADQWQGLLEMPDGDAPFDDYRTLIKLVD